MEGAPTLVPSPELVRLLVIRACVEPILVCLSANGFGLTAPLVVGVVLFLVAAVHGWMAFLRPPYFVRFSWHWLTVHKVSVCWTVWCGLVALFVFLVELLA